MRWIRVAGHRPLLDFLLSFRYPLSGEYAMRRGLAGSLSMRGDWGLETGLLCEVFRHAEPGGVCQVDGGANYDHKHQPIGSDAETGLYKMSKQIAQTLLGHLSDEGLPMDVQASPLRSCNGVTAANPRRGPAPLPEPRNHEQSSVRRQYLERHAIESFARALDEAVLPSSAKAARACELDACRADVARPFRTISQPRLPGENA